MKEATFSFAPQDVADRNAAAAAAVSEDLLHMAETTASKRLPVSSDEADDKDDMSETVANAARLHADLPPPSPSPALHDREACSPDSRAAPCMTADISPSSEKPASARYSRDRRRTRAGRARRSATTGGFVAMGPDELGRVNVGARRTGSIVSETARFWEELTARNATESAAAAGPKTPTTTRVRNASADCRQRRRPEATGRVRDPGASRYQTIGADFPPSESSSYRDSFMNESQVGL